MMRGGIVGYIGLVFFSPGRLGHAQHNSSKWTTNGITEGFVDLNDEGANQKRVE